jgi:hypothetical protein
MKIDLNVTRTATFVAGPSGASNDTVAQVEMSPYVYGVTWNVQSYRIRTNSAQTFGSSRFYLYRDFVSATNEVDSTYDGDGSTDPDANIEVTGSQKLIAYWTGGDLGATAQITLRGTVETGRQ